MIGWKSETVLSSFNFDLSDLTTGAFIETGATNIDLDPGDRVLGGNTNIEDLSVTRSSVSITLTMITADSAFGAGSFGVNPGDSENISAAVVTATFSGDTAQITLRAEGWDGSDAEASFTGVYQLSDTCE